MSAKKVSKKPQTDNWLWWQVKPSDQHSAPLDFGLPKISRHVLNLRALPKNTTPEKAGVVAENYRPKTEEIDLLNITKREPSWFTDFTWKLAQKSQSLSELSVVIIIDVLFYTIHQICFQFLFYYLRTTNFIWQILKAVWFDLNQLAIIYGQIVGWIFTPLKKLPHFNYQAGERQFLLKGAMMFCVLALVLTLPIKGLATLKKFGAKENEVKKLVDAALQSFQTAGINLGQGKPEAATVAFGQAEEAFTQAKAVVGDMPEQMAGIIKQLPGDAKKIVSLTHLLLASRDVSTAARLITSAWAELSDAKNQAVGIETASLPKTLYELKPILSSAVNNLSQIDSRDLPQDLQTKVAYLQTELTRLVDIIGSTLNLPSLVEQIFYPSEEKTYVLLFQNSSELRPTGGFAGSLAFISVKQGEVTSVHIPGGGPYDFQGQLSTRVRPPEPIRLVRGEWQLQDANWFFDFPTSAQKVMWFIEQSKGPKVDGVVAITPDIALELLKLTGPITLPKYHKTITADNFLLETQSAVELEYDKNENKPKQFIADLFPELINRVLNLPGDKKIQLGSIVEQALRAKSLQFYLNDTHLEHQFSLLGWAGEVKKTALDYLAVVYTNIGGGKTDLVTTNKVIHQVEVLPTGDLVDSVSITRSHQGNVKNIFENRRNVDYLRLYVPAGAELLSADGFTPPPSDYFRTVTPNAGFDEDLLKVEKNEKIDSASGTRITDEFGKTVFGNWLSVSPGETRTVHFTYKLPFTLSRSGDWQDLRRYSVYFQKQAGVKQTDFESTLKIPTGWRVRWYDGSEELTTESRAVSLSSNFQQDEYYGVLLENIDN